MTEPNLIISYIGDNCSEFLSMSFDSIIDVADKIIFVWGKEDEKTDALLVKYKEKYPNKFHIIESKYDQNNKGQNGKQRNIYLDYLKKYYLGDWNLTLDPDEVIVNQQQIKPGIKEMQANHKNIILSPHIRHLITYLNYEDDTFPIHFCPGRLFKITNDLYYNEVEHPVLQCKGEHLRGYVQGFTIFHLAYISYVFNIRERYLNNIKKTNMHTQIQLDDWYYAHISGTYKKKKFIMGELPKQVKEYFMLDKLHDYAYYINRKDLEVKHFTMSSQFLSSINKKNEDITILDLGCGMGLYGHAMSFLGIKNYLGVEKNKYAVENCPFKQIKTICKDITKPHTFNKKFDLVLLLDVLEHLKYQDLDNTLNYISKHGKKYIFCTPYNNDPDLYTDDTHVIKENKDWWVKKLSQNFTIENVPNEWTYAPKLLIGVPK